MTLKDSLTQTIKSSMKAREMEVVKILRNVQAAIKKVEIDHQTTLDDNAVLELLQKQIKQRQESLDIYQANGRDDLVAKEKFEIEVIGQFLPAQLDEAALNDIIATTITELEANSMKDMGRVMNAIKEKTVGQADPAIISGLVKKALTA